MKAPRMRFVFFGLSITSSWGNGHATTYRSLVRELAANGHDVLFLERDMPWYADNRDMPEPPFGTTRIYGSLDEARQRFARDVRDADVVVVGSYVPDGVEIGAWAQAEARGITAFYDIDTPVTQSKLARQDYEYITPKLIAGYDLYLSFTGGPTLQFIEETYGSPAARVLYCSVDPKLYYPESLPYKHDLGYLGTYGADRQPTLDALLCEPARKWAEGRFIVAGPMYPKSLRWPENVERVEHLSPQHHRSFYNSQRFTLNVTRADMIRAGYSPSVRLFEAAACATPIISDDWDGLDSILCRGSEILVARTPEESLYILRETSEEERIGIGARARKRVLSAHTAAHRAAELERYVSERRDAKAAAHASNLSTAGAR